MRRRSRRPSEPPPGSQALLRSELYFGRLKPDGSVVTDAEWRAFVVEHVTPRFPDGFTVLDAVGQYRTRAGELKTEPTKIFIVIHPRRRGHARRSRSSATSTAASSSRSPSS